MKHLLPIIILVLIACLPVQGQGIVSENNTWNVKATGFPGFLGTETYKIEGDSSYDGIDYKIIWRTMDSVDIYWSYMGLLREETDIVYYIQEGKDSESILYDFNLLPGDTAWIINMFCWEDIPALIIDLDTIEYFGVERRRWELSADWGYPEYWIEGIGSNLGPLHSLYSLCIVCPTWDLLCFHTAGTQYYQMYGTDYCYVDNVGIGEEGFEIGLQMFPNPVREKFEVRSAEFEVELLEIYDLSGKKHLTKHFPGGEMHVEVELDGLAPGLYVCRILTAGMSVTRKLVIQ